VTVCERRVIVWVCRVSVERCSVSVRRHSVSVCLSSVGEWKGCVSVPESCVSVWESHYVYKMAYANIISRFIRYKFFLENRDCIKWLMKLCPF